METNIVQKIKENKQKQFRKRKHKLKLTDEEVQTLALAWASNEISYKDFTQALEIKGGGYLYLAIALRDYINSKK